MSVRYGTKFGARLGFCYTVIDYNLFWRAVVLYIVGDDDVRIVIVGVETILNWFQRTETR